MAAARFGIDATRKLPALEIRWFGWGTDPRNLRLSVMTMHSRDVAVVFFRILGRSCTLQIIRPYLWDANVVAVQPCHLFQNGMHYFGPVAWKVSA